MFVVCNYFKSRNENFKQSVFILTIFKNKRFFKGSVDEFEVVKEDESIDIITGQRLETFNTFMRLLPFNNIFVY